ncbi:hypothetical protein AWP98_19150 [Escherichia coli]|nr:hypothetical protein AWP97_15625 [Escherichia coli]OKX64522.1 hypothetical protein AWP98_19150 [Escherichia coli]
MDKRKNRRSESNSTDYSSFHAGCGVNALSGLQDRANSIYCNSPSRPDKRSASGNFTCVTCLKGVF